MLRKGNSTESTRHSGQPPNVLLNALDLSKLADTNGNASKSELSSVAEQPVTLELTPQDDVGQPAKETTGVEKAKVIHISCTSLVQRECD